MKNEVLAEALNENCWAFARYMLPDFMFGDIHKSVLQEMGREDRHSDAPNLLVLIPRDHLKSVMLAVYATWRVARNPAYTILYITADEDLGRLQMSFMQNIFESDRFKEIYPDHFYKENGRRDKWTSMALNVDHPRRTELNIRDETIAVKTIKSGKTGRHPDEIMYDDLVVPENAYTALGRKEVRQGAAQAVSLNKTNSLMTGVGTTYHPQDQYAVWGEASYPRYDEDREYIGDFPLWKIITHKVESQGDGLGEYLWPRVFSPSLKQWFGWDISSISRKKAEYISNGENAAFYAQYYMEPNDPSSHRIKSDQFQYFNPGKVEYKGGDWYYAGKKLRIGCFLDVAVTDAASRNARKADYTALAVVGVDPDGFYYILELNQFQTDKRQVYYDNIIEMYRTWKFKKVHIELENAGKLLGEALKDMIRKDGYSLVVDGKPAPRGISKFERHASITVPKYENGSVLHRKGGWTPELEEQIMKERPAHDDLLDVVTAALDILKPPASNDMFVTNEEARVVVPAHNRFGGRRR